MSGAGGPHPTSTKAAIDVIRYFMDVVFVMSRSQLFKLDKLLLESATNLKPKVFKCWRELGFFICVALDNHRFWIIPFGVLDKFKVKVYDNSPRYREYENGWELLEK